MTRILIVRLSALGDVIHGVPVVCALREALPDAFIGWVVEGRAGDVLEGHPALDTLIRVPRRWLKSPAEAYQLRRRLHALHFDTAIDLQCLTKSAMAAWLSGARRRIGKAGADGRELSKWLHNELVDAGGSHVVEHYLDLLRPLGIEAPSVRFDLPENEADTRTVEQFLADQGLAVDRYLVINPGAGWPSKIWPQDRYGELARHVGRVHGLQSVVVWAGDREQQMAARILGQAAGHAMLAPATSVTELAAIARRARLFVGSDTGPMHLAVAVGTATVSLHGPSRAEWCGAYGDGNVRLQVCYDDGTARHRRTADDSAMRAITVEMVCRACDRLLQ